MKIDFSLVPAEKLTDPLFLRTKANLKSTLSQERWLSAFCVHEAAHETYFRRAGWQDFDFRGPTILYDQSRDVFVAIPAAVRPRGNITECAKTTQISGSEFLASLARGHAAGGVATRLLTTLSDLGDDGDYEDFRNFCDRIRPRFPSDPIDTDRLWREAKDAVERDLRSPSLKRELWKRAQELRPLIFKS